MRRFCTGCASWLVVAACFKATAGRIDFALQKKTEGRKPSAPRSASLVQNLLHWWQESGGTLANLAPIRGSFYGGVTEMEPNEHARYGVLIRRLGEGGIGSKHRLCVIAGAAVR